ncbi:MAG: HAMP domain-containing protein [Deltaproteobacteria bacterium]|nr:MAG: HAMP domain-containing protein [Deltaproteobacteria bacterium]
MNTLKRRIILNQATWCVLSVMILGLPCLWLSVDLTESQVGPFLIIYALDAVFLLGFTLALALKSAKPVISLESAIRADKELDRDQAMATLQSGVRMPARLALLIFSSGCGVFLLSILAMLVKAHFSLAQSIQAVQVGVVVFLTYSLFTMFTVESIILPVMAEAVTRLPERVPLRGIGLSQKLLITCGSLVLIAVLLVSSISFMASKRALENQAKEMQRLQLDLVASAGVWPNLINKQERKTPAQATEVLRLDPETGDRLYLLDRRGTLLGSIPHGAEPSRSAGFLAKLLQTDSGSYVDGLQGKIYAYRRVVDQYHFLVSEVERSRFIAPLKGIVRSTSLICILALAVGLYLSYTLANSITKPVSRLGQYARQISEGRISEKVALVSGDELGLLADGFAHLHQNLVRLAGQSQRIASGDFSQRVTFPGHFGEAITSMVNSLQDMTRQSQEAASRIGGSSSAIAAAAQEQASGAAAQAASVSETTATMEELSTTARQIAENSDAVKAVAEETLRSAKEGQHLMEESTQGMALIRNKTEESSEKILDLGRKSQQIGEIIEIINEIAIETKMLSLNAAIEAAKAGDAGRGFAAVAGEIRRLAEDVVKSTTTIRDVLLEIQTAASASVLAAEQNVQGVKEGADRLALMQDSLENIIAMADQTAESAREFSVATKQQKEASEQVAKTMREISRVTQHAATTAKHSISSASDLNRLAEELRSQVSQFKVE